MANQRLGQFQRVELGFGADSFHQPIAYSGKDAWVRQIVQLCTMDKGTIASNPTIGVGIRRFDFLLEEDRRKLEMEINRQVPLFFPDMPFLNCQVVASSDDEDQDVIFLAISLNVDTNVETVGVAMKKTTHYIEYRIVI